MIHIRIETEHKIWAIKAFRDVSNLGLLEAKNLVEHGLLVEECYLAHAFTVLSKAWLWLQKEGQTSSASFLKPNFTWKAVPYENVQPVNFNYGMLGGADHRMD